MLSANDRLSLGEAQTSVGGAPGEGDQGGVVLSRQGVLQLNLTPARAGPTKARPVRG